MILLAGVSVTFKQLHASLEIDMFGTMAAFLVMGAAGSMTLLIFVKLLIGFKRQGQV